MESFGDALRAVPGLTVSRSGGRGALTSMFPRGGESDFTLVLVDGVRMNAFGGGFDLSLLDVGDIERIEFVPGPQSALYGADAIGGVVQVITKQRRRPGARGGLLEAGSQPSSRAVATTSGTTGAFTGAAAWNVATPEASRASHRRPANRVERRRLAPAADDDAGLADAERRHDPRVSASVRQRARISGPEDRIHRRVSGRGSHLARTQPRTARPASPPRPRSGACSTAAFACGCPPRTGTCAASSRARSGPPCSGRGASRCAAGRRRDQHVEQRLGRRRGAPGARAQHVHHRRGVRGGADRADRHRLLRRAAAATRHASRAHRRPATRVAAPQALEPDPNPFAPRPAFAADSHSLPTPGSVSYTCCAGHIRSAETRVHASAGQGFARPTRTRSPTRTTRSSNPSGAAASRAACRTRFPASPPIFRSPRSATTTTI